MNLFSTTNESISLRLPIGKVLLTIGWFLSVMILLSGTAKADLLKLKGQATAFSGFVLKREPTRVQFRIRSANGTTNPRWYELKNVEWIVENCHKDLSKLNEQETLFYAEKLCAMTQDWEARYRGIEILESILKTAKDRELRLHARWVAYRFSLSNKKSNEQVAKGILEHGKKFTDLLRSSPRLAFPDFLDAQAAMAWSDAIRMIRTRDTKKGRQRLKELSGPFRTFDCNKFASKIAGYADQLGDDRIELELLEYELLFKKAAESKNRP